MYKIIKENTFSNEIEDIVSGYEGIWYEGNLELLSLPKVSVIGSRNVSESGILRTQRITKILIEEGFVIVSGLAKGVDTVAHKTALENGGNTISVMGTPINEVYPKENENLKKEIIHKGLVLSQFKPGSSTQRYNFPKRNELMAKLSLISIVIEASEGSGTRHQISSALKHGRLGAFTNHLAQKGLKWVDKALNNENCFIIKEESEFREVLKKVKNLPKENSQLGLF